MPTDTEHEFATYLKQTMEHRGITLAELATRMNVSRSTISRYLNAKAVPTAQSGQVLATALDVPFATLGLIAGLLPAEMIEPPTQ